MDSNTKYIFLIIPFLLLTCKNPEKGKSIEASKSSQLELAKGFQLIQNNCFSCHSPNASIENSVAPSMGAIKEHYIAENTSQEQFTQDLIAFLNKPSEEKSKMPEAIRKFNLMPLINYSEESLTHIAAYIYQSEIEKPDWFEKQYENEKQKYNTVFVSTPIETGQKIALQTKGVLGKNLLKALKTKGTENALGFCSTRAIPLTDSMSVSLHTKIKRVSDKNRNPNNVANEEELAYIEATKTALAQNKESIPQLITMGDKQVGYYPILTNQMCLQCHGQAKTEVLPAILSKIEKLYPHDKALGYKAGELRGIWVVEMDKK